jgi:hypothetical protein
MSCASVAAARVERDAPISRKRERIHHCDHANSDPIFRFFLPPSSSLPPAAPLAAMDNARLLFSALGRSIRWRVGVSCDYWDEAALKGVCPLLTNSITCSRVQVRRFPTVHVQKR